MSFAETKVWKWMSSFAFIFAGIFAQANVSGTVFQDLPVNGTTLNTYGVKDANELGVEGVSVTAYLSDGTSTSTTTDANGTWSLTTHGDVRVEFSGWPTYLKESPLAGSNSSVQFASDGATLAFGLHDPNDYSRTANPAIVTPIWLKNDINNTYPVLYRFGYADNGQNSGDSGFTGNHPAPAADILATYKDIGTTWGIAYQKTQKRIFAATVVKRGSPMRKGTGYIYVVDNSGMNPVIGFDLNGTTTTDSSVVDLGNVCRGGGCENDPGYDGVESHYLLYDDSAQHSYDIDGAAKTGKASFGDIDMQPGTDYLWAVNLNQRTLMRIDVSNPDASQLPGPVTQYAIVGAPGIPVCTGGELRPWALEFDHGLGYLGTVCDGSASGNANDLAGYIFSFDPNDVAAGFTQVLDVKISLEKRTYKESYFKTWSEDWSGYVEQYNNWDRAQPIISDIEFNARGDMVIGVIDRGAMIVGRGNYSLDVTKTDVVASIPFGDIYHACKTDTGYTYEGLDTCPTHFATGQGYDGHGEYYDDKTGDKSPEGSEGALALLKGSNVVALTTEDPRPASVTNGNSDYWNSHGVHFLDTASGEISRYYGVFKSDQAYEYGKSSGIGDLEILTDNAPVELGNRVWLDANGDGIQDANETGISGVTVQLLNAGGTVIGTVTTDAQGIYVFSNDPDGIDATGRDYNITQLIPGAAYTIRIPDISCANKQAALGANVLTVADTGEGAVPNGNDSDGAASGCHADASVLPGDIPLSGANNHSFDFGFTEESVTTYCLGDYVWYDTNHNGIQDGGETGVQGVDVKLYKDGTATGDTNTTDADGKYLFCGLGEGNYSVAFDKTTLPADYEITTQDAGSDDAKDSDANPTDGKTAEVEIKDSNNTTLDMGIYKKETPKACLGNYVWEDADGDGVQDSGESGVKGVKVYLLNDQGDRISGKVSTTDSDGKYSFCDLDAGTYSVEFDLATLPSGYVVTLQNAGSDDARDSDADTATGKTAQTTLSAGDNDTTWDMGIKRVLFRIGDLFWIDTNGNGVYDSGEKVIGNAKVELLDAEGNVIGSTTTDENGRYHFDVPAGEYKVRFHIPQEMIDDDYTFVNIRKDGDDTNKAGSDGVVEAAVEVGPGIATENLTLDAAINCGCANVASDSGDSLSIFTVLLMMILTLGSGLVMVRHNTVEER